MTHPPPEEDPVIAAIVVGLCKLLIAACVILTALALATR